MGVFFPTPNTQIGAYTRPVVLKFTFVSLNVIVGIFISFLVFTIDIYGFHMKVSECTLNEAIQNEFLESRFKSSYNF